LIHFYKRNCTDIILSHVLLISLIRLHVS